MIDDEVVPRQLRPAMSRMLDLSNASQKGNAPQRAIRAWQSALRDLLSQATASGTDCTFTATLTFELSEALLHGWPDISELQEACALKRQLLEGGESRGLLGRAAETARLGYALSLASVAGGGRAPLSEAIVLCRAEANGVESGAADCRVAVGLAMSLIPKISPELALAALDSIPNFMDAALILLETNPRRPLNVVLDSIVKARLCAVWSIMAVDSSYDRRLLRAVSALDSLICITSSDRSVGKNLPGPQRVLLVGALIATVVALLGHLRASGGDQRAMMVLQRIENLPSSESALKDIADQALLLVGLFEEDGQLRERMFGELSPRIQPSLSALAMMGGDLRRVENESESSQTFAVFVRSEVRELLSGASEDRV